MAFDPENHIIDPQTGFAIHKDTNHVIGLTPKPTTPVHIDSEWPKWVVPHESHIVRKEVEGFPASISTPGWEHNHVNRLTGEVTVLVSSEEEEKAALAEYKEPDPPDRRGEALREDVLRQVQAEVGLMKTAQRNAEALKAMEEHEHLVREEAIRRSQEVSEAEKRALEEAARIAQQSRERLDAALGAPNAPERRAVLASPERNEPTPVIETPPEAPEVPYDNAEPHDEWHKAYGEGEKQQSQANPKPKKSDKNDKE